MTNQTAIIPSMIKRLDIQHAPILKETCDLSWSQLILCPHCAQSAHLGDGGLKRNAEIGTMPILGKLLIDADKVMDY